MGFLDDILEVFYPLQCGLCRGKLVASEEIFCLECINTLPFSKFEEIENNPVFKVFKGRVGLESAFTALIFSPKGKVQQLLHQLKYNNKPDYGVEIGKIFGNRLAQSHQMKYDGIIPVPLHKKKRRKRGYNQAEEFARGLSMSLGVELLTDVLIKTESNTSQTKKTRFERWKNVEEVYEIKNSNKLINKHILLVDDVITTGATIDACASRLLAVNCNVKLSAAAIAYTL